MAADPESSGDTVRLERVFTLPVPPDRAFEVLTDAEQITDVVPGATLTSWDGTTFEATVRLRLGLLPVAGHGVGRMTLRDDRNRRVRVEVARRGGGTVAVVALEVRPGEDGDSVVRVRADMRPPAVAGRLGRSMVLEIGERMFTSSSAALVAKLEGEPRPAPVHEDGSFVMHLPKVLLPAVATVVEVTAGVTLAVVRRLLGRR